MFSIFKETDAMRSVEERLAGMLADCRQMYGMATSAVFGEVPAESVGEVLWSMDKGVNKAERSVRRELLVHSAVGRTEMEQPLMLAYMSVAKDVERIGDYCKNVWDLANYGVDLSGQEDTEVLRASVDEVGELLDRGSQAFVSRDEKTVHQMIPQLEVTTHEHDRIVFGLLQTSEPGSVAVPRALLYRFLKRIVGHMANILTSVVMPLDRIDFYKQPKG